MESLDEIAAGDRLEVEGKPRSSASAAGSGVPSFGFSGTGSAAAATASDIASAATKRRWREAVTSVLEKQRQPEVASHLLSVVHAAAVVAKRAAASRSRGGDPGGFLVVQGEELEALRRHGEAVAVLHALGFRKASGGGDAGLAPSGAAGRAAAGPAPSPPSSVGVSPMTSRRMPTSQRFELAPSAAVGLEDASAAIEEAVEGRRALVRLLAIAEDAKRAAGVAAGRGRPGRGAGGAEDGAAAVQAGTITPESIASATSSGSAELASARAEVAALALRLGDHAVVPSSRRCVILPTPRTRPPALAAAPPLVPVAAAPAEAAESAADAEADGVEDDEDDEDDGASAPMTAGEWGVVERAHQRRLEIARAGSGAVRARALRAVASAGESDAPPVPMRVRVVFPDRVTLVADFGPLEPCTAVAELAARCLDGTDAARLRVRCPRPEGGSWALCDATPLALAGIRKRASLSVTFDTAPAPAYTAAVRAAVEAGGAEVDL